MFGFLNRMFGEEASNVPEHSLFPHPKLSPKLQELDYALRRNALNGDTILMNQRDTSFSGICTTLTEDEYENQEMVDAIKSIPVHY